MLKIRLQRVGRKNDPSFRIVVTDSKNGPKSGRALEVLGSYDARRGEPQIKGDRVKHWMSVGAQVSDTVNNLLVKAGIIEGKMINVLPKKSPIVKELTEEEKEAEAKALEDVKSATKDIKEEEKKQDTSDKETPVEEKEEKKEDSTVEEKKEA